MFAGFGAWRTRNLNAEDRILYNDQLSDPYSTKHSIPCLSGSDQGQCPQHLERMSSKVVSLSLKKQGEQVTGYRGRGEDSDWYSWGFRLVNWYSCQKSLGIVDLLINPLGGMCVCESGRFWTRLTVLFQFDKFSCSDCSSLNDD